MLSIEKVEDLDTPCIVIDEAIALANIRRLQDHCNEAGLALRPHIKTHKMVGFARAQMDAGAVGINCQKIGEAEVMADGGLDDILITFNILGADKLKRLRRLAARVSRLAVTADSTVTVTGLSEAFADAERPLDVLVECDTGAGRCGVQTPEQACDLAAVIAASPGLRFAGLMTYPAVGGAPDAARFMREAVDRLAGVGLDCPVVSTGGSPDMSGAARLGVFTEYRAGTYIYNDRSLVERGACGWQDCALGVLATVVSLPAPGRAVIDAGSKSLTSDLLGLQGFGHVAGSADTAIVSLSEEHGVLHHGPADSYRIGQRILVIPNHVCVVSNLFDEAWLVKPGGEPVRVGVDARGTVS
ncbi:D-serine deaminase-like pyridoxal phosphate-dependent protein [Hoeflea marina]|uniref:D-serine deaminase-like pyridoxal phosphate-dependent protein n=1 Tax=Hoeflea marina TaxID=274592 RepID=A0A317PFV5_9HYPH|nr:D-TA family PLP-dependent enzyme [Hoeflea marina]PWV98836.1 D-serine deaminase-like pyridoxal phosphate-dependent protein [Hoeflea marina]